MSIFTFVNFLNARSHWLPNTASWFPSYPCVCDCKYILFYLVSSRSINTRSAIRLQVAVFSKL